MNKTLVILAAGMGSRFGGLKQIEQFGPHGEFIIDYSVYDAIKCGFNKVVFVIKEENFKLFKNTIGNRVSKHVKVEYVFQKNEGNKEYQIPENRIKPLGTAHAVYCASKYLTEPFLVIGADDFFGRNTFKVASDFIDKNQNEIGVIGYNVFKTLSLNGTVKRGVIISEKDNFIKMDESKIDSINNKLVATSLNDGKEFELSNDTLVSMNVIVFPTSFIKYLEIEFDNYLKNSDLLNDEFLLPNVITNCKNDINVKVIKTDEKWVGVTYKEDCETVRDYINELIEEGIYNDNLWSN